MAQELKANLMITDCIITDTNLKTKASANFSLDWAFKFSKNVVLLEDDLLFIDNPSDYIEQAISVMNERGDCVMATLFASRHHERGSSSQRNLYRLTRWPIMWGIILNKENYSEMRSFLGNFSYEELPSVINGFSKRSLQSRLVRLFRKRFEATWNFKFKKAVGSETAWDTHWQLGLWAKDSFSMAPLVTLTADTGVDYSSVSPGKQAIEQSICTGRLIKFSPDLVFCPKCEKSREVENKVLPRCLSRISAHN